MCRLFGLHAGAAQVHASYWLLAAPDSIAAESRRNPDGTGIGWFDPDGIGRVRKWPEPAFADRQFRTRALSVVASTVVTHVRAATTGARRAANCHPFLVDNRLMAHNGGFGDLAAVERQLGSELALVHGDTDSERFAALIAQQAEVNGGSVGAGITAAATWLAAHVPMYSLNTIVATDRELWALRYPDQRALHVATRTIAPLSGTPDPGSEWHGTSGLTEHHVTTVGDQPVTVVVVASERIDDSDDWRMLDPGELLRVGPDLAMDSRIVIDHPPARFHLPPGTDPNFDGF